MYKKIILILLLIINVSYVNALEFGKIVSLTNKCNIIQDNETNIPVKVIAINDGILSKNLDKYILGNIDHDKEQYIITINNIKSDTDLNIKLDNKTNKDNRSNLYLYTKNDLKLSQTKKLVEFNINIKFINDIPDKIYILGTEIILTDQQSICNNINSTKISSINKNNTKNNNFIIIFLIILNLITIILLLRKNKFGGDKNVL